MPTPTPIPNHVLSFATYDPCGIVRRASPTAPWEITEWGPGSESESEGDYHPILTPDAEFLYSVGLSI